MNWSSSKGNNRFAPPGFIGFRRKFRMKNIFPPEIPAFALKHGKGLWRASLRLEAGSAEVIHIDIDFRRSQPNLFIFVHGHLPSRIKNMILDRQVATSTMLLHQCKIYTGTPSFARYYVFIPNAKFRRYTRIS